MSTAPFSAPSNLLAGKQLPKRPEGYWQRVAQLVDAAPPLDDDQRARIRAALHQPAPAQAAAA